MPIHLGYDSFRAISPVNHSWIIPSSPVNTIFWLCHQQPKLKWTKIHTLFGSFTILRNKIFLFLSLLTMDMQEQEEDSSNFYSMKVTIESKLYVIRSNAWQQIYSYKIPVSSNIAWRNKIKRHKVTYKLQPAVVLLSKR